MNEMFKKAIEDGASDIHIKAGDFVRARLHGELTPLTDQKSSHAQVQEFALKLIPHERDRDRIDEIMDYDCSWGLPGLGRFRVNILRQRGVFGIVMRIIPIEIPTFADLRLPEVLETISKTERGLVLVTGVTGSGKSSTMAAMIGYINRNMKKPHRHAREPHRVSSPRPQLFRHTARRRLRYGIVFDRAAGCPTPGSRCAAYR